MSQLRAAVVGTGHLGQHHARIYSSMEDVDLIGVVDLEEKRGRQVARKCKTKWHETYDKILGELDIASIAVPTKYHFDIAKEFIDAGVAVLIEKPMTATLAHAQQLVELAAAKGVPVQVGHVERFNPSFVEIRKILDRPGYIEADRISPFSFRSTDISVVLDLMIHDIDIILHLTQSKVERVDATGVSVLGKNEDVANARLHFENGCVANLTASRVSMKSERKIRIFQEDAYVSLDFKDRNARIYRKTEKMKEAELDLTKIDPRTLEDPLKFVFGNYIKVKKVKMGKEEPLAEELASFVKAVQTNTPTEVTAEDGLRAIEVAHRIQEAIAESQRKLGVGCA